MGIGPVFAVPKVLKRLGLTVDDIDLWELNEAFAVQVLYCADTLGIPMDRLNVNGGAIAVGHPYGGQRPAPDRPCADRRQAPRREERRGDDVHRRRHGRGRRVRGALIAAGRTRAGRRAAVAMSYRRTVDFLLYDWLDVESLRDRPRFADHSRETFDAVLDTCERIAREKFAPYNRARRHRGAAVRRREGASCPQATPRGATRPTSSRACSPRRRTTRSAACSCPASSRWRRTASSRRPASASAAAAC